MSTGVIMPTFKALTFVTFVTFVTFSMLRCGANLPPRLLGVSRF